MSQFVIHSWSAAHDKGKPSSSSSRGQVALLREILSRSDHVCYFS